MSRRSRKAEYKRYWKQVEKDYRKLSELTGIPLEEAVNHSYGVVVRPGEKFRQVGVYIGEQGSNYYFRFKDKKELGFDRKDLDEKIYWALNIRLVLLVHSQLSEKPLFYGREAIEAGYSLY